MSMQRAEGDTPNHILIESSALQTTLDGVSSADHFFDWLLFFVGLFIPTCISILVSESTKMPGGSDTPTIIYGIAAALFLGISLTLFFVWNKRHKKKPIFDLICDAANEKSDYTAVFVIAQKHANDIRLLIDYRRMFLPYTKISTSRFGETKDALKTRLATMLGIEINDVVDLFLLNENRPIESIKPKDDVDMNPRLIRFDFYTVTLKKSCATFLATPTSDYKWESFANLRKDPRSLSSNSDVVNYLKSYIDSIRDSFEIDRHLKVIWNITKQCQLNCATCATHDSDREELTTQQKEQVMLRLLASGYHFDEIDFSGGDPLYDGDTRALLQKYAIKLFDHNSLAITTTHIGIKELLGGKPIDRIDKETAILLSLCELTLDADKNNARSESSYTEDNYIKLLAASNYLRKLRINIPIFGTDFTESEINTLVKRINDIGFDEKDVIITLLRLMPVGKKSRDTYPVPYNPHDFVEKFKRNIRATVNIHCALRGKLEEDCDNCTMAERKIGIDCAGNVFACAWAGYLKTNTMQENPFYMGNLLNDDLSTIMENDKALSIRNKLQNKKDGSCCIFSYLYDLENSDPFSGKDPLLISNAIPSTTE